MLSFYLPRIVIARSQYIEPIQEHFLIFNGAISYLAWKVIVIDAGALPDVRRKDCFSSIANILFIYQDEANVFQALKTFFWLSVLRHGHKRLLFAFIMASRCCLHKARVELMGSAPPRLPSAFPTLRLGPFVYVQRDRLSMSPERCFTRACRAKYYRGVCSCLVSARDVPLRFITAIEHHSWRDERYCLTLPASGFTPQTARDIPPARPRLVLLMAGARRIRQIFLMIFPSPLAPSGRAYTMQFTRLMTYFEWLCLIYYQ